MVVVRVIAGALVGLFGLMEGADIATGGKVMDFLTHIADKKSDKEEE